MSTVQSPYTPQELLALPDSQSYELVDGELVERNVSVLSSLVEAITIAKLQDYSSASKLGVTFPSSLGIQCFPDEPKKIRRADASFVRAERFSDQLLAEGFLTIAPDLAAEVLSPNDLAYEIDEKIEEYLKAGVSLIWVINPETCIVMVHRQDGTTTKLGPNDELTGENVLPGFRCRVADLFPAPTA